MLQSIADDPVLERPFRREPRCPKRRPKNFQLLTRPRHLMKEISHQAQRKTKDRVAA
jgi:hypothetical protein